MALGGAFKMLSPGKGRNSGNQLPKAEDNTFPELLPLPRDNWLTVPQEAME